MDNFILLGLKRGSGGSRGSRFNVHVKVQPLPCHAENESSKASNREMLRACQ